jgi:hypothetical protein
MSDLAHSPKLLGQLELIAREANNPSVLPRKADDDDPVVMKLRTRPTLLSLLADGVGVADESMAEVDVAALLRVQPARALTGYSDGDARNGFGKPYHSSASHVGGL